MITSPTTLARERRLPETLARWLIPSCAALIFLLQVSPPIALAAGCLVGLSFGNPYIAWTRRVTQQLLAAAIVGLGAAMNLNVIARTGLHSLAYTAIGLVLTFAAGALIGSAMKTRRDLSLLITAGTAICGGSAIAAVARAIHADDRDTTIALATVFVLNAVGLVVFPPLARSMGLTDTQFGLWSALAIHDTSSVVGATLAYGGNAVVIGTTVKLTRALWIVPVAIGAGYWYARNGEAGRSPNRPWFVAGFLLMAALTTWVPAFASSGLVVATLARRLLIVALFLIGVNLTRATIRTIGAGALVQALSLWVVVALGTLGAIEMGWIR